VITSPDPINTAIHRGGPSPRRRKTVPINTAIHRGDSAPKRRKPVPINTAIHRGDSAPRRHQTVPINTAIHRGGPAPRRRKTVSTVSPAAVLFVSVFWFFWFFQQPHRGPLRWAPEHKPATPPKAHYHL